MMRAVTELSEREQLAFDRAKQTADLIAWLRSEAASRDGAMAWYVARTRWQADSVARDLEAAKIDVVCPMERRWKRYPRSNRRYPVDSSLFGNHLFVQLLKAESAWVGLLTFEGIDCLLGDGERPVALREGEVAKVMMMLENPGGQLAQAASGLAVGDAVVHPVGSFAELHGVVREIDHEKRTALVSTVLFGREIATRCGIDDIEKLA